MRKQPFLPLPELDLLVLDFPASARFARQVPLFVRERFCPLVGPDFTTGPFVSFGDFPIVTPFSLTVVPQTVTLELSQHVHAADVNLVRAPDLYGSVRANGLGCKGTLARE